MVDGVGVVLGLQAQAAAQVIGGAVLAGTPGEEVGGIDLYAGLIGGDGQGDAALLGMEHGGGGAAEEEVGIVAAGALDAGLVAVHRFAQHSGGAEVHGGAVHGKDAVGS